MKVNFDSIPYELTKHPQWVVWKNETYDGKPRKVPYNAADDSRAQVDDPCTWSTFDTVRMVYHSGNYDGVGFVFTADDPYVGIDLDDCMNGDGKPVDPAQVIIDDLATYCEVSPSGNGVKLIGKAIKPGKKCRTKGDGFKQVEMYDKGRYFTITGHLLDGCTPDLNNCQGELFKLYKSLWPPKTPSLKPSAPSLLPKPPPPPSMPSPPGPNNNVDRKLDDDTILKNAFLSKNGAVIKALFDGDVSRYSSASEADLAFVNHLAFYFNRDANAMDRMFRRSGLMRDKWDEKRGDRTYGQMTIGKAILDTVNVFDGGERQTVKTETQRSLVMRSGLDIDDPPTAYLWKNRLVRGAVNIIFSRPGRGKSTLGANMTAKVTNGGMWPDGTWCEPGDVIYLKGEGSDRAIADRMSLAGADPAKYHLSGRTDGDDSPMIDLAYDIPLVEQELKKYPDTKLLIVDTISTMYPSMKAIDNAHIGKCLWPLQELAERFNIAVVVFAHTNKGQYNDPLDRLSGGRAIGGIARAIWMLGKVAEDNDECCLAVVKANDFLPASSLSYVVKGVDADKPGLIEWTGEVDVTAWELDRPKPQGERTTKAQDCQTWLAGMLGNGPAPVKEIKRCADEKGFGEHVMEKARSELRVEAKAAKGRKPPVYYYCIPGQEPPDLTESTDDAQLLLPGGST